MVRKILVAFVAMATMVIAPATAANAYSGCSSSGTCFYDGFGGVTLMVDHDSFDGPGCFNLPTSARYRTSSIDNKNTGGFAYRVYLTTNCGSFQYSTVWANTEGNMAGQWNNSIVSFRRL